MARRMLINATHAEETRVIIADDDRLLELEIERADQAQLKGNIYKAAITRVEPSLQAAFLDIGSNRNGFLQINDIHSAYFNNWPPETGNAHDRPSIQDVLHAGQELVVQVVKDERDAKGATLTTNISIPGRFLVLMVGNQRGGVSRKINDEGQRYRLKQAVQKLRVPAGMGVIVRTAGINKSSAELQRDLDSLLDLWYDIADKSFQPQSPKLLYKESDLAIRTIRDYITTDIEEILIDEASMFERVSQFVQKTMPSFSSRVKLYDSPRPLFSNFHLDAQVEAVNQHEVTLPSGGSIVINVTEAIVAIDVNSGRSTGQSDVEETAYWTNKEAAEVLAKQLRLRDLGGLIVIDFIDMNDKRHKQAVERALKDSTRYDKAKVEIGKISKFGLLEMSRQRLKTSLVSQSHVLCPHCSGRGRVKAPESASLEALRKVESSLFAGGVNTVRLRMAPAAALFLLNSKRKALSKLEADTGVSIFVYADGRLKPEEYELELDTGKRDGAHLPEPTIVRNSSGGQQYSQSRHHGRGDNRRQGNYQGGNQDRNRNRDDRGGNNNQRRDNRDGGRDRDARSEGGNNQERSGNNRGRGNRRRRGRNYFDRRQGPNNNNRQGGGQNEPGNDSRPREGSADAEPPAPRRNNEAEGSE